MNEPSHLFISTYIRLFFLLTPFFVLSVFLSLTRDIPPARRRTVAAWLTFDVILIGLVLYFLGNAIFSVFGITLDAFRVGAGALLFLSAVDLVRGIAPSPALAGHEGEALVHEGAGVGAGAVLVGGTVVGRGAEIGAGARLDGAVVFDGAKIEAGATVERSIIGFGAQIGHRALVRDGVIGDGAVVGARCELLRGARVWPGVEIPDGGIRYSTDI